MNQDVNLTDNLLKLCVLHKEKNNVTNSSLAVYVSFSTKQDVNYVLYGQPYSTDPTVIIARNDNDNEELHPNGVLFMDGYWFGLESEEYNAITSELESQFLEMNSKRLGEKLEVIKESGLLPTDLMILA